MKRLMVLAGCVAFMWPLAGCQDSARNVTVVVEGGGQFPEFLVGTWKAEGPDWEFVFEPDGTISSALIGNGAARVDPSRRFAKITVSETQQGIIELGQWTAEYWPQWQELGIEVVVERFVLTEDGEIVAEGSSVDSFVGPVSQAGGVWQAEWSAALDFTLFVPEPVQVPPDPNGQKTATLLFKKQPRGN